MTNVPTLQFRAVVNTGEDARQFRTSSLAEALAHLAA